MKEIYRKSKKASTNDNTITGDKQPLPPKIRVYALAKILGITSKDLIKHLDEEGVSAYSAQSNIDRKKAESIRDSLSQENPKKHVNHDYNSLFTAPAIPKKPFNSSGELESDSFRLLRNSKRKKKNTNPDKNTVAPTALIPANAVENISEEEITPARRNRRGRRGKGRGRKRDQNNYHDTANNSLADKNQGKVTPPVNSDSPGDDNSIATINFRRTRRRTRQTYLVDNDPSPGTVHDNGTEIITETVSDDGTTVTIHQRPARRKHMHGVSEIFTPGSHVSSRITSKHQRRRENQSLYRYQSTISEEEFQARRKAVERIMLVREKTSSKGETYVQVGVLEDGILVEHFVTTSASTSLVGNIYFGEVQNVLPSMEAAFVNIGLGRNGVLYAGEVDWERSGLDKKNHKIEDALKPGNRVLVQVTKDPVGQKGARLTTQVSLAGRYLVFIPESSSTGISRRLPDTERRRLKALLSEILPEDCGVIVRTAAESVTAEDFRADLERLQTLWSTISTEYEQLKISEASTVQTLYEEPDFLVKVVRDLFNEDFTELIVEGDQAWGTVENYITSVAGDLMGKVKRYTPDPQQPEDFFTKYKVEEQLAKALDRKVWLPSGGTLIIERTEAMTVIDVNTGKFVGEGGNLEQTVTQNNLEAAEEIVRQLRLRDIGGMIIIDFIDMILESNQELVLAKLQEELSYDRTRHQISEVTSLGLVQLTRKRIGTGLLEAFSTACEHCHGLGLIIHHDPIEEPSHIEELDTTRNRRNDRRDHHTRSRGNSPSKHGESKSDDTKTIQSHGPAKSEHPIFKTMHKRNHIPTSQLDESPVDNSSKPESSVDTTDTNTTETSSSQIPPPTHAVNIVPDNIAQCSVKVVQRSGNRHRSRNKNSSYRIDKSTNADHTLDHLKGVDQVSHLQEQHIGTNAEASPTSDNGLAHHNVAGPEGTIVRTRIRRKTTLRPSGPPQENNN